MFKLSHSALSLFWLQLAQLGINLDGEDAATISDPELLMEVGCSSDTCLLLTNQVSLRETLRGGNILRELHRRCTNKMGFVMHVMLIVQRLCAVERAQAMV